MMLLYTLPPTTTLSLSFPLPPPLSLSLPISLSPLPSTLSKEGSGAASPFIMTWLELINSLIRTLSCLVHMYRQVCSLVSVLPYIVMWSLPECSLVLGFAMWPPSCTWQLSSVSNTSQA